MWVMDLPGWPPLPGGATSGGKRFPVSADQVTIERVLGKMHDHVLFSCKFYGASVFFNLPMLDENNRERIAEILHDNISKTLLSIGSIEIPED